MPIDIELLGIGLTVLTPVYGSLWYLVTIAIKNQTNITNIQLDVTELKLHLKSCRYCSNSSYQPIETTGGHSD